MPYIILLKSLYFDLLKFVVCKLHVYLLRKAELTSLFVLKYFFFIKNQVYSHAVYHSAKVFVL
ncbi:hypothetical protein I590_00614 [Enterococcus raffinosus ATCC 49464]|uniref:Uncharacterized protein n=1 Tax=Enterococcus raffinosus ATCC 49464 TaxID=1158602 RepID=A0ABN0MAT8_9ENTE|nr:hypothetical protein I590_00614 [Enterococcus raffinosus ATCC 49464]